jgi:tetratricopeptide (TPR) repeat protein
VSGTVRWREGKQRIALRAIETASGSVVSTWIEDTTSESDFSKATVIRITQLLGATHLTKSDVPGETTNAEAKSYYERGKDFLFRQNLTDQARAIESLRRALELDPAYGQAFAMLATGCSLRALTDPDPKWFNEAEAAAARALQVAPMLPEAHLARGGIFLQRGNLRASVDPYLTAYELDPTSSRAAARLGYVQNRLGRPDLALAWFEKAAGREARPLYADSIGAAWLALGDHDKAEEAYRTASIFRPDLPVGALGLAIVALYRGDFETARRRCGEARTRYPDNPQPLAVAALIEFYGRNFDTAAELYSKTLEGRRNGGIELTGAVRFLAALGYIKSQSSEHDTEGRQLLIEARQSDEDDLKNAPENPEILYSLAANCGALGEYDKAVATLAKAISVGWLDDRAIEFDPRFDSIRETDAFKSTLVQLTTKVGDMRRQLPSRELAATQHK